MHPWTEKATQKISRLLSFLPNFRSPSLDRSQARSYFKKNKSLSSADSSVRSSKSTNRVTSHSTTNPNDRSDFDHDSKNRKNSELECSSESIDERASNGTDACNTKKSMPYLMEDSSFISPNLYDFLLSSLPNMVKGCQWALLYSTEKHGISLRTLIRRSSDLSGPCLLIAGDEQGTVFGGLLECPLKPSPKRKYQGTNQTFVFTTMYGEPRLFRPTGANRFFYMCLNDLLAFGGGGNFALCLDEDLLNGTSGPCETFGNQCLAHSPEFELKNVELWGFTHSSSYLT